MTCGTVAEQHRLPNTLRKWQHRPYVCDCGRLWYVVVHTYNYACTELAWAEVKTS